MYTVTVKFFFEGETEETVDTQDGLATEEDAIVWLSGMTLVEWDGDLHSFIEYLNTRSDMRYSYTKE